MNENYEMKEDTEYLSEKSKSLNKNFNAKNVFKYKNKPVSKSTKKP